MHEKDRFEHSPSDIFDGRKVVAVTGTAIALSAVTAPCSQVVITGLESNGDTVYIGGSTVEDTTGTETGIPLNPLSQVVVPISDLSRLYLNGTAGDGVSFAAVT